MFITSHRLPTLAGIAVLGSLILGCGGSGGDVSSSIDRGVASDDSATVANRAGGRPDYVPNQVLVKFEAGVTATQRGAAFARVEGKPIEHILTKAMERANDRAGVYLVATKGTVEDAIITLSKQPGVIYAEPNYIYQHNATSNDTYYTNGSLWGMYGDNTSPTNQYGSRAGEAWANNHIGSTSVHVAVIDEGVMLNHTDLSGQVWVNPFDPADGVDNDGNGFVDDVNGWDFDGNNNTIYDGGSDDHGTHVAGTIGAKGGNGTGVVGVVWNTRIIAVKFLGKRGGTTANAIKAFDYVTDLKTRHGIDIVASNNSWGGGGFSQALKDAIDRHGSANILAMCAAGNSGVNNDSSPHYPSSYTSANIIAVASINSNGAKSSFSNYGATSVDLGAPGNGIVSTVPSKSGTDSNYASYGGTSMATPHVTGAAAMYAASNAARGSTLKSAILNSTIATTSMNGITTTGGRLNAESF